MAVSNDRWTEPTKRVQQKFLSLIETDGKEEYDTRDIERVRNNAGYVCKFVRQQGGDESKAFNMLVDAMKWRKSFGANDLDQNHVNQSILDMGLSYPRGVDRNGNVVVILNIRLHRKDNFPASDLQKFVVCCLETHLRFFPDKQVTMLFDMSETGISNLDLDFIRFFISCFRLYYPCLLAVLLVYELPWILQAAWKIVKSWLGDRAAKKIKFVSKSTITEYIDCEELLERYGGQDSWVYSLAGITDNMRTLANRVLKKSDESSLSPEISFLLETLESNMNVKLHKGEVKEEAEEMADEDKEALDEMSPKKQVRFSGDTKLTSSHRSRYNNDPNTQIRRRHVEKLLGMQSPPKKSAAFSLATENSEAATVDSDGISESDVEMSIAVTNPSPLLQAECSSQTNDLPSLEISPQKQIQFSKDTDGVMSCVLKLTNPHDLQMAFKVKTTAPSRYKVKPSLGHVASHGHSEITLRISPGMEDQLHSVTEDRFLVQSCVVDTLPFGHVKQSYLASRWKTFPKDRMSEHLLRCSVVDSELTAGNNTSTSAWTVTAISPARPLSSITSSPLQSAAAQSDTVMIKTKVDELTKSCNSLHNRFVRLMVLQLLTIILLVFLLVLAFVH